MVRPPLPVALVTALTASVTAPALANPAGDVTTLGGGSLTIDYRYELDTSDVEREHVGSGVSPTGGVPIERDLAFRQNEHTVTPRAELGIARDTWLSASLPVVIAQDRQLSYDTGVTAGTSSTVAAGILPATGLDAADPSSALAAPLAFRGVTRYGLDQLWLGIGTAAMNQRRDDTKPTWKLGADVGIPVGKVAVVTDRTIEDDTGVGRGVYDIKVWMSFDRRLGRFEPYTTLFWDAPFATTSHSLFQDPGFGATNVLPGQRAGADFGVEILAYENADHDRISIDLGGRIEGHFEGRDYSPMWELFAYAGDAANPANPLVLDGNPLKPGSEPLSNPGITDVENYLELAGRLGVRADFGKHLHAAVTGEVMYLTDHSITFDDAGIDRNGNGVIDPGTSEVNPLYLDQLDLVGHRYISTNNLGVVLGVEGRATF